MLGKLSQSQNDNYHVFALIKTDMRVNLPSTENACILYANMYIGTYGYVNGLFEWDKPTGKSGASKWLYSWIKAGLPNETDEYPSVLQY